MSCTLGVILDVDKANHYIYFCGLILQIILVSYLPNLGYMSHEIEDYIKYNNQGIHIDFSIFSVITIKIKFSPRVYLPPSGHCFGTDMVY